MKDNDCGWPSVLGCIQEAVSRTCRKAPRAFVARARAQPKWVSHVDRVAGDVAEEAVAIDGAEGVFGEEALEVGRVGAGSHVDELGLGVGAGARYAEAAEDALGGAG